MVAQSHDPQQFIRGPRARSLVLRAPVQFPHHEQLFARGEGGEQVGLLEDDADALTAQLCRLLLGDGRRVDACDLDPAGIRLDEGCSDRQEAGLPRPGRTGEACDGAAGDLEVRPVDRGDATVAVREREGDVGEGEHEGSFRMEAEWAGR
ncbi:hypothetical protein GCM10023159_25480 [Brevibacterium yomogidense]